MSGELALIRAGRSHYEIVANGVFLTATYNRRSERALARLGLAAVDRAAGRSGLKVLVGGLGVGHTLAAVLSDPRAGKVVVCELEPKVLEWNRTYFRTSARALADPRVKAVVGDLFTHLRDVGRDYDLILADTDNGPDWLVRPENYALYTRRGAGIVYAALVPGGAATFWSAAATPWFEENLRAAGFAVSVVPSRRGVLPPDVIYVAAKPPAGPASPPGKGSGRHPETEAPAFREPGPG